MIIGLTGKKQSGKSTVARILCENFNFVEFSFAGPMRVMLSSIGFEEPKDKELIDDRFGFSYRQAMQSLGTEWGRKLNPDLWLNLMKENITDKNIVISDVRFENEAEYIRSVGKLVHIQRDTGVVDSHISEQGITPLINEDVIYNDYTINDLYNRMFNLIK